jgi:hypothetical protein
VGLLVGLLAGLIPGLFVVHLVVVDAGPVAGLVQAVL